MIIFPCSIIKSCQMAVRINEAIKTAQSVEELVEAVATNDIPKRVSDAS